MIQPQWQRQENIPQLLFVVLPPEEMKVCCTCTSKSQSFFFFFFSLSVETKWDRIRGIFPLAVFLLGFDQRFCCRQLKFSDVTRVFFFFSSFKYLRHIRTTCVFLFFLKETKKNNKKNKCYIGMKKYSHCEVADSSGRKKKSTALFLFSFPSPSLVLRRAERPALFCLRVFFEVWRLCLHVALFQPSGFRYHPPLTPTCFFFFSFSFSFRSAP